MIARNISRRDSIRAGLLTALGLACGRPASAAGGCPEVAGRTARWIVPYASGGGYDVLSRLIGPYLEARLGAEIAVENVSGAGGLVGAKALRDAAPDGLTLGIVNAPGLLAAKLLGEPGAPDLGKDLVPLGRLARNHHVWVTGAASAYGGIDDVLAAAADRQPVFAVSEVGGTPFISASVGAAVLELDAGLVAGYPGSREMVLSLLRGETDIASLQFDSAVGQIEAGELRPLLQVSDAPVADHASLSAVPVLGGPDGIAAKRATQLGKDPQEAALRADTLAAFIGAGRVVAVPAGLPTGLSACLETGLLEALADPGFREAAAKAQQAVEPAGRGETQATLDAAAAGFPLLEPILDASLKKVRS
jgi:tripartite-type tricarboxylate transporter receptor subunit TctC